MSGHRRRSRVEACARDSAGFALPLCLESFARDGGAPRRSEGRTRELSMIPSAYLPDEYNRPYSARFDLDRKKHYDVLSIRIKVSGRPSEQLIEKSARWDRIQINDPHRKNLGRTIERTNERTKIIGLQRRIQLRKESQGYVVRWCCAFARILPNDGLKHKESM